ncbi:LAQU0S06e00298g1_1 [Lachancea quebecensis]|uniref:LAQU0S06e00298g1_1 n=1 Tax=Lachancea quebecensis TaxID=1654605 RepID=A0A0P1L0K8_9SACH|nr:LAQU0S06e00298g1_1 [Lachancea quebecensis]
MPLSFGRYMNLAFHLDSALEPVPTEISRKIVSSAVSPVVTVTSTAGLDEHIQESYGVDSLYMLLRYFGDCVSDRDQAEAGSESDVEPSRNRNRARSNSLFQRQASHFLRFTRPLTDLIGVRESRDLLFDYHSLEVFLEKYLGLVEANTASNTPHKLLQHSIYHKFFTTAISSTAHLSPYESFNHPVASLLALDISRDQGYEEARDLLIAFKNMHNTTPHFPAFINVNDILPVFLLCYEEDSREQFELCQSLSKTIKKQLFVESLLLPCWGQNINAGSAPSRVLHQPIMSSLEEIMYSMMKESTITLPLSLINYIYDRLISLIDELMIPFMKRKISFWDETILQPRKSIFPNSKFFRKLISKAPVPVPASDSATHSQQGVAYFAATSNEFILRKLADWSFMLSDFKNAYSTYELLSKDFEQRPEYLASCLEWCALSVLMGAQSIVTVKMIKNDIDPLINRALKSYELSARKAKERNAHLKSEAILRRSDQEPKEGDLSSTIPGNQNFKELSEGVNSAPSQSAQSYETRCMLLAAELFLSLSDTWTATPYAIKYLETILDECTLGSLSEIVLWERLAYCYALRVDPRVKGKLCNLEGHSGQSEKQGEESDASDESEDENQRYDHKISQNCMASLGLARRRKSTLFRLIATKKWTESKQWRQAYWGLKDIETVYSELGFANRDDLILEKLRKKIHEHEPVPQK